MNESRQHLWFHGLGVLLGPMHHVCWREAFPDFVAIVNAATRICYEQVLWKLVYE